MAVSVKKARDFVYGNGALWEKALFGYLFDGRPAAHVQQCLLCYKNADGGYGHDLEHDITCPESHPLALEFLLFILRDTGLPAGTLLDGTAAWVEANRCDDGSLKNPGTVRDYPLAPWWVEGGGQTTPDSITGNLMKFDACTPDLANSTKAWVLANLTLDNIRANEWLFMAYHAHDYFMNVTDFPDLAAYRQATLDNINACTAVMPEKQAYTLFQFATTPDNPVAQTIAEAVLARSLDYLLESQREDGGWTDEHDLPQWQPYTTILILLALQRYGRL